MSFRIALRYFFSGKSHGAVNVISGVSVAGVAVATAAIVIVLSVFNGFSNLTRSRFSAIDPDLKAIPREGKVFSGADSLALVAESVDGVEAAVPTLTERGLIIAGDDTQLGVVFTGVGPGYDRIVDYEEITDFYRNRPEGDTLPGASVAVGVASRIDIRPESPLELYTLRRVGRINPANPISAFFSRPLTVERIISIDQMEFDADNIIIPLDVARELLQYYDNEASAIDLRVAPGTNAASVARSLKEVLPDLDIITREQQHSEAYRMIAVEKWVTFTMLIFILIIAAFNIVSTLSLMVIEKRDNMTTLRFLGADRNMVRRVFEDMGAMITAAGGIIGIILGVGLALAQQWGGFIKLSGDQSMLTITAYPVRVEITDILAVASIVAVVAVAASLTTRIFTKALKTE